MLSKNDAQDGQKSAPIVLEESKQAKSNVSADDLPNKSIRTGL